MKHSVWLQKTPEKEGKKFPVMPSKRLFTALFPVLRLQSQKWMDVQVGDIIKLENNQFVTVSDWLYFLLLVVFSIINLYLHLCGGLIANEPG